MIVIGGIVLSLYEETEKLPKREKPRRISRISFENENRFHKLSGKSFMDFFLRNTNLKYGYATRGSAGGELYKRGFKS